MQSNIFNILAEIDKFLWSYVCLGMILLAGLWLSFASKFVQISLIFNIKKHLKSLLSESSNHKQGIHPIKLYFTSVGGMVGLGNVVGVTLSVKMGGPGIIIWMWVASFVGMILKYSEIYLGIKYRIKNSYESYDGGPMYYLQQLRFGKYIAIFAAFMLCIYGVEIYQFVVLVDTLEQSYDLKREFIIAVLLITVLYTSIGGVRRISNICSVMMPVFLVFYICICMYIIVLNFSLENLKLIFNSSLGIESLPIIMVAYSGISKAVYSGDICIGYDSVVQSETSVVDPKKQARLSIYALLSDTFICTMTALVVVFTGEWSNIEQPSNVIPKIFESYISYSNIFYPIMVFLAGYTTIIAFFSVGKKASNFISQKGYKVYFLYSIFAFIFFSYHDQSNVSLLMSISSAILVIINAVAIILLRKEIRF